MKLLLLVGLLFYPQVSPLSLSAFNPITVGSKVAQLTVDFGKQGVNLGFNIAQKSVDVARGITNAAVEHFGQLDGANLGFNIADGSLDLARDVTNTVLDSISVGLKLFETGMDAMVPHVNRVINGVNRDMEVFVSQVRSLTANPSEITEEKMEDLKKKVLNAMSNVQDSMQNIVNEIKKNTDVIMSEEMLIAQRMPAKVLSQVEKVANQFQNVVHQLSSEPMRKDIQKGGQKSKNKVGE